VIAAQRLLGARPGAETVRLSALYTDLTGRLFALATRWTPLGRALAARQELIAYVDRLIAERRERPAEGRRPRADQRDDAGRLRLPTVALHNKVDFAAIGGDIRRFGEASPGDLVGLVAGIARGEVVSPEASAAMLDIMERQQYLDQVPRYLNFNP
jgi:hypothetical protein